MEIQTHQEIKLFFYYARVDQAWREEIEHHISDLKIFYNFKIWSNHQISPGENREMAIERYLKQADVVLLLLSSDFWDAGLFSARGMQEALKRHNTGEAKVIPVLLRPFLWKSGPFHTMQVLPKDALPISLWSNKDSALYDVATGIDQIIEELLASRTTVAQHSGKMGEQDFIEKNAMLLPDNAQRKMQSKSRRIFICHSHKDEEFSGRSCSNLPLNSSSL